MEYISMCIREEISSRALPERYNCPASVLAISSSMSWFITALFLFVSVSPSSSLSSVTAGGSDSYLPNKYIVEMANFAVINDKRDNADRSEHEHLYHHMHKRGITFDVSHEFNTRDIFVGASITLRSADDVARISKIPGVKAVRPVLKIRRPRMLLKSAVSDPNDTRQTASALTPHIMTGVDRVHAQGFRGEGIKIGIIDDGIDYTHPALGGAIGLGHKVTGGHDFTGDKFSEDGTPNPDEDPLTTCDFHGTHVAGIIGADPGNEFGIVGVAPMASITGYRVFSCNGDSSEDIILQGLERAYNDGMDIISISLGWLNGWTSNTYGVAANRIAEQGRIVVVGAGNDGDTVGSWSVSSFTAGVNVISVGSVNNEVVPSYHAFVLGVNLSTIAYSRAHPITAPRDLLVYATSNDTDVKDDACKPLPASTPELSDYVVVIRSGGCDLEKKMAHASEKGANVFLIYDPDYEILLYPYGERIAAKISSGDGKYLVEQFVAGTQIKLRFPANANITYPSDTIGGLMSAFSSYGPTYDMYMKPALSAPGGRILSTIPVVKGGYGIVSGTSMATPFVAGAAALVLQARGKNADTIRSMRDLLQSTATGLPSSKDKDSHLQTVSQQGAGLINVDQAVNTKTIVSPAQILLNDTAHFSPTHRITIKNSGSQSVSYDLSHVAAGTSLSLRPDSSASVELISAPAQVDIAPSQFTVAPGSSRQVTLTFRAPKNVDVSRLPVFSGFIKIASANETLKVTYLGAVGDLKLQPVLDTISKFGSLKLPSLGRLNYTPKNASAGLEELITYSMNGSDVPHVLYRYLFGSPDVRFDLCEKNTSLEATAGSPRAIPTIGSLLQTSYVPRSSALEPDGKGIEDYVFNGMFANLTRVVNGQYRILLRALKVTGDRSKASDYESWLSPPFGINFTASAQ